MNLKAKDIAEMLGISPATVSMVLNNKPGISEARRLQIIDKINELGCGHLIKNKAVGKSIGFVVYKTHGAIVEESPFFSYFIEGVNAQANAHGYNLMMLHLGRDMGKEQCIEQVRSRRCDGLIVFAVEMFREDLSIFYDMDMPFVILDNHFIAEDIDTVSINNRQGMIKIVQYLVACRHRRIGYIKSKSPINSFAERFETYRQALENCGLEFLPGDVFPLQYSELGSYSDMKEILAGAPKLPTALVADNDLLAIGAMKALQECGYQVPRDISIIGFDDRPISLLTEPQLTTVSVPKDVFGPEAVDLLVRRMQVPKKTNIHLEIGVELIERGSVAVLQK